MLILLFIATAISTLALCLWAYGARADIEKQDPEFATALYRSGVALFWSRGMPLRGNVLLFSKPSAVNRSTLVPLQVMYCINAALFALCIGAILISIA